MMTVRPLINGVLGLLFLANTPFLFAADTSNPVKVESLGNGASNEVPYQAPVEDDVKGDNSSNETQYQLQVMQQEVRDLRGMVEDLQHQVKQMRSTQEDRYLELDSRVQNLQKQMHEGGKPASGAVTGTGETAGNDIADVNSEDEIQSSSTNEKSLYETGLDLIRKRQYDMAIQQLEAVIAKFPNGDFTANAYYWLGEVYAAKPKPDYEKARQALTQVMTYFPDNRKVPDAAFKLGKVYFLMGECKRAEQTLQQVVKDYPGKSVAKLAENYLRDKVHCDN